MNNQSNRLNLAQEFARNAHSHLHSISVSGIKRPNIHHIQEVADLVWISGGTDDEVIAAWLHDCVEDTDTTLDEIEKVFGANVAQIVDGLTDHRDFKDMDLPTRKGLQAERLKNESASVHRVKIADQTSNIRSLALDPVNDMTYKECYDYICGAKMLADECRGVSELLDKLFDDFYKKGLERYKESK